MTKIPSDILRISVSEIDLLSRRSKFTENSSPSILKEGLNGSNAMSISQGCQFPKLTFLSLGVKSDEKSGRHF